MTTRPTESDPDVPDAAGRTDLGEGTPDPTGPINTGHEGDASLAANEDAGDETGPIVAGRQAHEAERNVDHGDSDAEQNDDKTQSAERDRPGPIVAG
jgi:hypothetical protein